MDRGVRIGRKLEMHVYRYLFDGIALNCRKHDHPLSGGQIII